MNECMHGSSRNRDGLIHLVFFLFLPVYILFLWRTRSLVRRATIIIVRREPAGNTQRKGWIKADNDHTCATRRITSGRRTRIKSAAGAAATACRSMARQIEKKRAKRNRRKKMRQRGRHSHISNYTAIYTQEVSAGKLDCAFVLLTRVEQRTICTSNARS